MFEQGDSKIHSLTFSKLKEENEILKYNDIKDSIRLIKKIRNLLLFYCTEH